MAGTTIKAIDLSDTIKEILTDYNEHVNDFLEMGLRQVTAEGRKELRQKSPRKKGGGKYRSGWQHKVTQEKFGRYHAVIYNGGKHRTLSHLLEKGHATRNGKFVPGKTHIAPVNEQVQKDIVEYIENAVSKG